MTSVTDATCTASMDWVDMWSRGSRDCSLREGHKGAHRASNGIAWVDAAEPEPITDAQVEAAVDVMLRQGLAGRTWPEYARAVLEAARDAS